MIILSNLSQYGTMLLALILGFGCCLFYDVFRILRKGCRFSAADVGLQDVVCGIVFAVLTFLLLLTRCMGEVRFYVLFCEGAGFLICRVTLSRVLLGMATAIINTAKRIKNWFARRIFRPVGRGLRKAAGFLFRHGLSFFKKVGKWLKKCLKGTCCWVYNKRKAVAKQEKPRHEKNQKRQKTKKRQRAA